MPQVKCITATNPFPPEVCDQSDVTYCAATNLDPNVRMGVNDTIVFGANPSFDTVTFYEVDNYLAKGSEIWPFRSDQKPSNKFNGLNSTGNLELNDAYKASGADFAYAVKLTGACENDPIVIIGEIGAQSALSFLEIIVLAGAAALFGLGGWWFGARGRTKQ